MCFSCDIPCIEIFHSGKVCGFCGSIGNRESSSETVCAIVFGYKTLTSNRENFPVKYSLILHAAKVFHLERFAMYGNTGMPDILSFYSANPTSYLNAAGFLR